MGATAIARLCSPSNALPPLYAPADTHSKLLLSNPPVLPTGEAEGQPKVNNGESSVNAALPVSKKEKLSVATDMHMKHYLWRSALVEPEPLETLSRFKHLVRVTATYAPRMFL